MSAGSFARLQQLFDHAVDLSAADQDACVAALTGPDAELREQLRRLLARHRASRLLPDQPALAELDRALQTLAPEALTAARTIGPFRIEQLIGDGGMGRVYRAVRVHDGIEQQVAIKLVRPERINASLLQRFSIEHRLLAALDHPNICRFIDAGTLHDQTPYLIMELIDGEPLTAYCDAHRLSLPARLQLLRKVLAAVAHAHRKLIVHRDIKPANVLVDRAGEPRLVDFGIAKSLTDERGTTATAERFFSPTSAAPEQIRGDPITVACDVYALGMLAYELLSGRLPFEFDELSSGEIERLLLTIPPPPMSQRVHASDDRLAAARRLPNARALQRMLHGDLDTIVQRCLRKSAAERYQSVEQLDAELARVQAGQPIHARGGERLYRLRRFVGRNRLAVALASGLALAVLAGGTAIVLQNIAITEQRNAALSERDRAQQVVELLQESFAAANPLGAGGGDVTATDILDAARTRIDPLFDVQPDVHARLAVTIARLDIDLHRYAQASELGARAVDSARRGSDTALLRDALVTAALAAAQVQDHARAQSLLDEALALEPDPRVDWLLAQAAVLTQPATFEQALPLLRRAVDAAGAAGDDDASIEARARLSDMLRRTGRVDEAVVLLRDSVARLQRRFGDDHPRVMLERLDLASALSLSGETDDMFATIDTLIADIERVFGASSALAGRAHLLKGASLLRVQRYADAIPGLRRAGEILAAVNGERHLQTQFARYDLAVALWRTGSYAEADQTFTDLLAVLEPMYGVAHPDLIPARATYAEFLILRERPQDAYAVLAPALDIDVAPMLREYRRALIGILPKLRDALTCTDRGTDACTTLAASLGALQAAEAIDTRTYVTEDPAASGRIVRTQGPSAAPPAERTP